MKQVRMLAAIFVLVLSAQLVASGQEQSTATVIDDSHRRVPLGVSLPVREFELGVYVKFSRPGVIVSNATQPLRTGAFQLRLDATHHPAFDVWDGGKWVSFVATKAVATNSEVPLRVVRRGGLLRLDVFNVQLAGGKLDVPLAPDPIVAGDDAPTGYQGEVRLLVAREPLALPSSRLWDPLGTISAASKTRILELLQKLDALGLALGVCALPVDGDDAKRVAIWWDVDMHQSVLPATSGTIFFAPKSVWVYRRTLDFNPPTASVELLRQGVAAATQRPREEKIESVLSTFLQAAAPKIQKALASAKVGSTGGEVSAPSGPRVVIPAGALDREVTLSITEAGGLYRISTDEDGLVFRKPIQLSLPVPPAMQGKKIAVAHFLTGDMAMVQRVEKQDGGYATVSTNTLSDWMVFEEGRLTAAGAPAGAAFVGTGVLILLKASSLALLPSVAAMVAVGYVGWLVGDAVHSVSMMRNLAGPIPGDGFEVYWHAGTIAPYPAILAYYEKGTGKLVLLTGLERGPAKPEAVIGPAKGGAPALRVIVDGVEKVYEPDQLESRLIPKAALVVLGELQYARWFYKAMGFEPPASTWVAVHPFLSATNTQGKELNVGEWDGKVLSINTKDLGAEVPLSDNIRSTIAHEYWHALSRAGFFEAYPGKDESIATNMESAVLASPDKASAGGKDFVTLRNWLSAGPVLRNGLNVVGSGEDRSKRGYDLWAWPKFILMTKGAASYVQFVQNKVPVEHLEAWWKEFALATVLEDRKIENPGTIQIGGQTLYTLTNFSSGALFASPRNAVLSYPTSEKSRFEPFSLSWDGVLIPARPTSVGPCPIIIRRLMSHQPERYAGQDFLVGPLYDPRRLPEKMSLATTVQSSSRIALPPSDDTSIEERRLPIVIFPTEKAMDLAEDSLLIYRLLPPASFTAKFANQTTLDVVVPPARGVGALLPMVHYQGYRLFLRRKDGKLHTVDLLYSYREAPVAGKQSLDPQTHRAIVSLPWTREEVADVGLATIDQGAPSGHPAVLSPIAWRGTEQPPGGATFLRAKTEARTTLPGDRHTDGEATYEFVAKDRLSIDSTGKEKIVTIVGTYTIIWPAELKPTAAGNVFVGEAELRVVTDPPAWAEVECFEFKQSLTKGSATLKFPITGVVLDPRNGIQVEVRVNGVSSCFMRAWYKLPAKS